MDPRVGGVAQVEAQIPGLESPAIRLGAAARTMDIAIALNRDDDDPTLLRQIQVNPTLSGIIGDLPTLAMECLEDPDEELEVLRVHQAPMVWMERRVRKATRVTRD